jgi:hypothetical protein
LLCFLLKGWASPTTKGVSTVRNTVIGLAAAAAAVSPFLIILLPIIVILAPKNRLETPDELARESLYTTAITLAGAVV